MSKPLPQQEYIVQKQEHGQSKSAKSEGKNMVTIMFRGSLDRRNYVTYIVEDFRNLKQWEAVLMRPYDKLRIQFDPGWISYGNTIDADSRPFIVADTSNDSIAQVFDEDSEKTQREENIAILQGLILTWEMYQANPDLIEEARSKLAVLQEAV